MKHTRVVSTKCTPGFACRAFSDTTLVCFIVSEHTTKCSRYRKSSKPRAGSSTMPILRFVKPIVNKSKAIKNETISGCKWLSGTVPQIYQLFKYRVHPRDSLRVYDGTKPGQCNVKPKWFGVYSCTWMCWWTHKTALWKRGWLNVRPLCVYYLSRQWCNPQLRSFWPDFQPCEAAGKEHSPSWNRRRQEQWYSHARHASHTARGLYHWQFAQGNPW